MGAWCEVCDDDGWVPSWGSKMSLTPASAKYLVYQPGLGTVLDSLRERLHPAREQDAVAGPGWTGWHLPVLSYRFEAVGGHTQAGREKPLMQVEQGLWSSCTVYPRSRSVLAGDACTQVPPSLNLPILRQVEASSWRESKEVGKRLDDGQGGNPNCNLGRAQTETG